MASPQSASSGSNADVEQTVPQHPAPRHRGMLSTLAMVGALLAAPIVVLALANYSGVCVNQLRVLSADEKIRIGVAYVVSRQDEFISTQKVKNYEDYQRDLDASVAAFIQQNPTCCRIGPEGGDGYPEPTLWLRLNGSISSIVVVEGGAPAFTGRSTRQVAITNCGRAW